MVDYSKWANIEISDDEDETHPNIHTPSLFRWRHQARIERMAEMEKNKEDLKKQKQSYEAKLLGVHDRLKNNEISLADFEKELTKIESDGRKIAKKEIELAEKEKKAPWNVDTISKVAFEKSFVNKSPVEKVDAPAPEISKEEQLKEFLSKYEELLDHLATLTCYEETKEFLEEHPDLVSDFTTTYLVYTSLNLAIEGKLDEMYKASHQCICMQYILESAEQMNVDPRLCVGSFFRKIQNCPNHFYDEFQNELEGLRTRIIKRAEERIKMASIQLEEEKQTRLGPGGLDPDEVYHSLPDNLKICFSTRNIELLQETINTMPYDVAYYHINRCVDAGLWIPDPPSPLCDRKNKSADLQNIHEDGNNQEISTPEKPYTGVSINDLD